MDDLPISTSASQISLYARCGRAYWFRYVARTPPERRSLALLLGSAVHGGIGWWFDQRLGGHQPRTGEAVQVACADLLADAIVGEVSSADLDELETDTSRMVHHYLEATGDLHVRAVEEPFEVEIFDAATGEALPRRLRGYFDLRTDDGAVLEVKTTARGWGDIDPSRHLQLGAYSYAAELATGVAVSVEAHVLVRTKREVRIDRYELASGQHGWWLRSAIEIERAIEARIFPPAPGGACSTCEYRQACDRLGRSETR